MYFKLISQDGVICIERKLIIVSKIKIIHLRDNDTLFWSIPLYGIDLKRWGS